MSLNPNRRSEVGDERGPIIATVVVLVLVIVPASIWWAAVGLGSQLNHVNEPVPRNPFTLFFGVLKHTYVWPPAATRLLFVFGAVAVVLVVLAVWATVRQSQRRSRIDHASRYMGQGRALKAQTTKGATATAKRLGLAGWLGVMIGVTINGRRKLYGSPEDMHLDIWGPRTGKTTSRAIPAILDAPGCVLATSNKRDLVDATRDSRSQLGRAWVFDPQRIALEPPDWWWNPLSYVTDDEKAAKLADHFASASRTEGALPDAYFEPAGEDLLAGLFLAAALDKRPVTTVFTWTTASNVEEAVAILKDHGYQLASEAVDGYDHTADKQRSGIFGTAQKMASCLRFQNVTQWVTPNGQADSRPQFDPHAFVRTKDTLYSLSREGKGSAGALVTALTAATAEAAEEYATTQPGGRLAVPMLGVLDEAANVCLWRELPALYSHYGSRGIILMTVLQSWSQGVRVWGRDGMGMLWSASNIKVYGGGVAELDFLQTLSSLIGDYDKITSSVNRNRDGSSVSRQTRREKILDAADLLALPRGRAVVISSGAPATLVETVPWMAGPHAAAVRASILAHDPAASTTLREASTWAAEPAGVAQ